MSTLFSLPLPTYQQPLNKSHSQSSQSKKRKRKRLAGQSNESHDALDDDLQYLPEPQAPASSQSLEYTAVLTPEERTQYRVAGQPFDQEPPPFPFPHSAAKDDKEKAPRIDAAAKRPLPVPTLHMQHLATITAILHRSLAARNYARASRAFGLILRDSTGGHAIDIRNEGRWGIGAEILLKAGSQHDRSLGGDSTDNAASQQAPLFTREGFERAKLYYERLIVQYPFDKQHAASVNALDFYQALFGLWIYIVHEEGKEDSTSLLVSSHGERQLRELEQAREIAGRIDACMSTIPFSDDLELIRLRGMVGLWIADLAKSRSEERHHLDGAMSIPSSALSDITSDISPIVLHDSSSSDPRNELRIEAAQSRRLAQQMFSRLQRDES